jgi:molecular chaperone GrpE
LERDSTTPKREESSPKNKEEKEKPGETEKKATKKELTAYMEKLEKDLSSERERAESYLRQLKYALADLENLRKASQKQVENAVRSGNERLVGELLVVLDDLELALKAGKEAADKEALIRGVDMVLKKFEKVLGDAGLKPIDALGKPFDPKLHEAVVKVETSDEPEGTVVEEIRKGYIFGGKVIRPSMVKVSVNPKKAEDKKEGELHGW